MKLGSPPPTRGTQHHSQYKLGFLGITPAYAGNTPFCGFCENLPWDHPRLRGEHFRVFHYQACYIGSPPPTRGTLLKYVQGGCAIRITPAYAGNTWKNTGGCNKRQDHPRLRGEHFVVLKAQLKSEGSPPPTRGTRAQ